MKGGRVFENGSHRPKINDQDLWRLDLLSRLPSFSRSGNPAFPMHRKYGSPLREDDSLVTQVMDNHAKN